MEKKLLRLPAKDFARCAGGNLDVVYFRSALTAVIVPISLKER